MLTVKQFLCLLVLGFCVTAAFAQLNPSCVALTNATLIDQHHIVPLPHQTVLVVRGRIAGIFPDGTAALPDSAVVIPARGKFLIPGLIDTHVHMATDPSGTDNREATLKVLRKMLYSGVTSVRDMAGDARVLAGLSRDARVGDIISPDIYYSALMAGPSFFTDPRTIATARGGEAGKMPYMQAITGATDLRLAVAMARGTGATGIKLYAKLDGVLAARIIAEARSQGMPVWGHAWLSPAKPSELVNAGIGSISHAPLLIYEVMDSVPGRWRLPSLSARFWDDSLPDLSGLFRAMKARGVLLDATLLTYSKWAQEDSLHRYLYEIGKRLAARAYKAGVTICAGTDDDQEQFVQQEMILLVKDAGLSPFDALMAATSHAAEAIHIEKDYGVIEAGKAADMVLLDKDPLLDIANVSGVFLVIKGGRVFTP